MTALQGSLQCCHFTVCFLRFDRFKFSFINSFFSLAPYFPITSGWVKSDALELNSLSKNT